MNTRCLIVISALVSALLATTAPQEHYYRAIGDACSAPAGSGTCQEVTNCKGIAYASDLCPNDPTDIQCCVEQTCSAGGAQGVCRPVEAECPGGAFQAASPACAGGSDVQCCIRDGQANDTLGAKVLAQAEWAAGLPYAWGGGSCQGPTHDTPPYEYGDVGFDCSGLVCWALCVVTGRDLFTEGLRNTHTMYCATEQQLGYQKYPFEQRQPGDAVFFGGACDCGDDESIHHVGLMIDSGDRLWNSPDDQINKVEEASISGFGEAPCPSVIRFA